MENVFLHVQLKKGNKLVTPVLNIAIDIVVKIFRDDGLYHDTTPSWVDLLGADTREIRKLVLNILAMQFNLP